LNGVSVFTARGWSSDLSRFHDSVDFCSIESIEGDRGPRNRYRRWSYEARPRDLLIFEPGQAHRAKGGPRADYRVLLVDAAALRRAGLELSDRDCEVHFTKPAAPEVYERFERLHGLLDSPHTEAPAIHEAFALALGGALDHSELGPVERVDDAPVRRALEFIGDFLSSHRDQHLSLPDVVLATQARGVTRLMRDFSARLGVGIYQYFKLRKFALAKQALLRERHRNIEHVAWDFGYTLQAFSREFRGVFGVCPRRYRELFGCRADD
jgi:AraC-like DNA-binding protein